MILLDTDVLVDVALDREDHADTRNLRDYTRSPIPAISPRQALTELA